MVTKPDNGSGHGGTRLRVLIVDEHGVFDDAIEPISQQPGLELVGIARTAEQAFSAVSIQLPDVVLVCVWVKSSLPESRAGGTLSALASRTMLGPGQANNGGVGVEAARQPGMAVTSRHGEHPGGDHASRLGSAGNGSNGNGSVTRDTSGNGVTHDLHQAAAATGYLTPREHQVLALLMEGASNKEMARTLSIRSNTVRTHVQNVLTKLRVHTRLGAATLAIRQGLANPPGPQPPAIPPISVA